MTVKQLTKKRDAERYHRVAEEFQGWVEAKEKKKHFVTDRERYDQFDAIADNLFLRDKINNPK